MVTDHELTWKPHIEYVTAKFLKFTGFFTNSVGNLVILR